MVLATTHAVGRCSGSRLRVRRARLLDAMLGATVEQIRRIPHALRDCFAFGAERALYDGCIIAQPLCEQAFVSCGGHRRYEPRLRRGRCAWQRHVRDMIDRARDVVAVEVVQHVPAVREDMESGMRQHLRKAR